MSRYEGNNKAHLRWSDYDNSGDVLPTGYKRLKDGTIIDTDCMDEDAKQASIPYTYNAPQHDWKCGYPTNN